MTSVNSWKESFNTYNSSTWIFSLFWLLNWFSGLLSIGHYLNFLKSPPYCLYCLCKKVHRVIHDSKMKKFIELWTNQKQTRDIALVQSKGTKTIYINSTRNMHIQRLYIPRVWTWTFRSKYWYILIFTFSPIAFYFKRWILNNRTPWKLTLSCILNSIDIC
jgi:hypothetical protein